MCTRILSVAVTPPFLTALMEHDFNPKQYDWKGFVGVYVITCKETHQMYVGSSVDVLNRLKHHRWQLDNNRHTNWKLQAAFTKYGPDSFRVAILGKCTTLKHVRDQEQWIIDVMKPFGVMYNVSSKVDAYDGSERRQTIQLISPVGDLVQRLPA